MDVIGAALSLAAAAGAGHRSLGRRLEVPGTTVRGWLRRFGGRAERVRVFFTALAVATGVDVVVAGAAGGALADAVAALGMLWTVVAARFTGSLAGSVTGWQVGCSVSGGRLLSPWWVPGSRVESPTRVAP